MHSFTRKQHNKHIYQCVSLFLIFLIVFTTIVLTYYRSDFLNTQINHNHQNNRGILGDPVVTDNLDDDEDLRASGTGQTNISPQKIDQSAIQLIQNGMNIVVSDHIAKGGYGSIYAAYDQIFTKLPEYVIKIMGKQEGIIDENRNEFLLSKQIMQHHTKGRFQLLKIKISDTNLVEMFDFFETENHYIIKMRRYTLSLHHLLARQREAFKNKGTVTAETKQHAFKMACLTMKSVYNAIKNLRNMPGLKYVVHRDIKTENILMDQFGNLVLADYGLAKNLTTLAESKDVKGTHFAQTPLYLRKDQQSNSKRYDGSVIDMYSLMQTALEVYISFLNFDKAVTLFFETRQSVLALPAYQKKYLEVLDLLKKDNDENKLIDFFRTYFNPKPTDAKWDKFNKDMKWVCSAKKTLLKTRM